MAALQPSVVGAALRAACLAELDALKPGNVHRYGTPGEGDGHGMTAADFEASAAVLGAVFAEPGRGVGARILESVRRTQAAVGCNTNLGIVLLAAPLAAAAESDGGGGLRDDLVAVLERLSVEDAALAFQAIALADPAGLAESEAHDVRAPARVDLRTAMAAAAGRDRIARQYDSGFADVFELGLPCLRDLEGRGWPAPWAAAGCYMSFLARFPDSHVARKFGGAEAEALRRRAEPLAEALLAAARPETRASALLEFDRSLKAEGLNPGTSADLTVASLFARRLEDDLGVARKR